MRIFTLFSFLLLSVVAALAQPTVNFETGGAGAGYTWNVFENGNNPPPLEIVANPSATGINTSTKVAKFTARADGQVYAGTENARGAFTTFDFSAANTTVKIMVYKSVISPVGLKFVSNGGAQPLKLVSNTKINEWEELTFDFSDLIPNAIPRDGTINIDQLNVFPDHRSGRVENVCYFDNITFSAQSATQNVSLDFEGASYSFTNFDGGAATKIANPNKSGINTSDNVAQMVKGAGATWAGSYLTRSAPVDFSTNKIFKVKVLSPVAGKKLTLKFEDGGAAFEKESIGITTANVWQELIFDYTGVAGLNNSNKKIVFIFDNGTAGDGTVNSTYLFDDVIQTSGTTPPPNLPTLPLDFESSTIPYAFTNFDGGSMTVVSNPNSGGINTSAKVAKMVKSADKVWGGSWIGLAAPIDFSTNKLFKAKIYSPRVGAKVLLKVENQTTGSINYEKEVLTTVANAWEELTFDYSAISTTEAYQKIIFIFDNGTMGDGSANFTFLVDDVKLVTSGTPPPNLPSLPLDFESATIPYNFTDFDGGAMTVVSNPNSGGINTSAKVARMVKSADKVWGGSWIGLAAPIDFSANKLFKAKIYSPRVGAKVLLKVENQTTASINFEKEVLTTVANTWEELTFDYSTIPTANSYQKITFIFDNGTMGDGSANFTFLVDDVRLVAGGTPPPNLPTLPLDFESSTIPYTFTDFGGGAAMVVANPQINGSNNSAKVGKMVKSAPEVYGGSSISLASPIDFSVNKSFKVKVYMPKVGAKLLLKVENLTNAGINFEREATGTVANAWEELTFDYSTINTANQYQKVVLIFDNGTVGDGGANFTYLFDDIRLVASGGGGGLTQMNLPVTFDDATVNYGLAGFGGAEASSIVTDPTLASNKVAKVIKSATAQFWAGTTITALNGTVQTGLSAKVPFTATEKKMNVRVWSPHAGIPVRLKVEDYLDPAKSVETEATSTVANNWETLTFDFATQAAGTAALDLALNYNKASIFFNFGTTGATAGERTYYFDDVKFGVPPAGPQTITFPAISDKTVGDAAFVLTATASSNLPVAYSTDSDKVTISGSTATIVKAGRAVIKANQAGNSSFTAAPEVTRSFCIKPTKPTVTLTEPTAGTFLLTSSSSAGNKWFLDGTAIASATNSTLTVTTPGIYKVQVTVDDCLSEFSADVPISVKGNQTITFPAITDKTVGNAPFSLTATASSTLPVAYSTDSDKVTISGSTVTIVKAGRVIVKANQAGNNSFNAAPEVTRSFCIKPAKPTVTATGADVETITLTSSASIGNKWFLNGTVIPSATNATFSANQPGIYKVQVTVDDCVSEFSSDVPLIVTGDLAGNVNAVNVYPNPAQDYLELVGINGELSNVQLVDLAGRRNPIHFEKRGEVYQANVQHLTLGIYLLQVQDGAVIHRIKVIKK
ncbi:MAG: T9SS type A sorting domain-containing protein [Cytophagales bacterium]|jgi:hypothetical protein|nr:T9SS type A sorting domain-containing protein [Cytophagales bacterium]MCA6387607.1 T9SS type A sorting domain-containing protein [Cytophagales bacterium]MCA6390273.1 T9SS type A sorting domain-containing protein [Cytophagales bacterium]MCA6399392.1 T9SS type A sorting domain-containing protein [Cytophagales bacterium]MCA6400670.1 T9SS type A sorting domain-containing protein [Cytophagales bacterium]